MLFIVFDIEIVFLYPLAVILEELAWFAFFEFLFFIGILVVAYVYVWRKERSNGGDAARPKRLAQHGLNSSVSSGRRRGRARSRRRSRSSRSRWG